MTTISTLSSGPEHHFFGYYNICPWDASGQFHLALETDFHDRAPGTGDTAGVGVIARDTGRFRRLAATRAFNLQQGAMLHWIDAGHGEELTFNDWEGERLVTRTINLETGTRRTLHAPIAAVAPRAALAIGLNFARTYACRRVTGYANELYSRATVGSAPADDGLLRVDLHTGRADLLISLADIERVVPGRAAPDQPRWIEHIVFNPDGTRLLFMCRITQPGRRFLDSLWTVSPDGSGLRCLIEYGHFISHFAWGTPDTVMLSCDVLGTMQFVMLDVRHTTMEPMTVPGFPADGHNAFSPDHRWIACDTYPEGSERSARLLLHDRQRQQTHLLGAFRHPPAITGDWRCDLHPRWSRDGTQITFDSVHEGTRQVYVADVADIVMGSSERLKTPR
jgi:hypothetical protein